MSASNIRQYISLMRLDHWIKQLFIIPGLLCASYFTSPPITATLYYNIAVALIATCLVASANYVINEWLDMGTDKYHPTKRFRSAVSNDLSGTVVLAMWLVLSISAGITAAWGNTPLLISVAWLWIMGILYNVKPFRTKDIIYLDVITESVNNAIRFFIGWFAVCTDFLPPVSIVFGYWMMGAYLMAIKRFAEYRMINDKLTAGNYRKSFRYYTEPTLLGSAFFYAMLSVFCIGVFLVKYKLELLLFIPFMIWIYSYYFWLSYKSDSCVQKPEKLYHEKTLMLYCLMLLAIFVILMICKIDFLHILIKDTLIAI